MNYKLSNIASREKIRDFTKVDFVYPYLYKPKRKINGLKEQSICVITQENPNQIKQAIWGMLPNNYKGDWRKFQRVKFTLHVNKKEIKKNILYKEAFLQRRCLIIVTGFYVHKLIRGRLENYLVENKNLEPYYLAGIYNVTNDGFITCSVINTEAVEELNTINNLYEFMPLQIPKIFKNVWLDNHTTEQAIDSLINEPYYIKLKVQKIAS
ncbi:SOS response-associated peptidase family protein [Pseudofulvibacter geojedonensis]|uniref:Abasic site processing protein n=1 Tax=Pseudofulvibacter geojedonensis TaxID=1123758 RepID=A0ABW3I5R0_9FLAO